MKDTANCGGLYVLLMWHCTSRLPAANLALKLLVVGYVAKLDLYKPHRYIADLTVRMGWSRR